MDWQELSRLFNSLSSSREDENHGDKGKEVWGTVMRGKDLERKVERKQNFPKLDLTDPEVSTVVRNKAMKSCPYGVAKSWT